MQNRIRILRGNSDRIVTNGSKLVKGQPLYNTDKNYLTIASQDNTALTRLPITVRELKGWFEDNTKITKTLDSSYYYIGPSNNDLVIKSPLKNNTGKISFQLSSTNISDEYLSIIKDSGSERINTTKPLYVDNIVKAKSFKSDTSDAALSIESGNEINFNIAGNTIFFGYVKAGGDRSQTASPITDYNFWNGQGQNGSASAHIHCGALTALSEVNTNTINANKGIFRSTEDAQNAQDTLVKILSTQRTSTSETKWRGRIMAGADNLTFLMGAYKGLAGLGVHSWESAATDTGAGWAPLYIQPDGTSPVYIGRNGDGWTPNTGAMSITGSSTAGQASVTINGTLNVKTINIVTT